MELSLKILWKLQLVQSIPAGKKKGLTELVGVNLQISPQGDLSCLDKC